MSPANPKKSPADQIKAFTAKLLSLNEKTLWTEAKKTLSEIFDSFTTLYGDELHSYAVAGGLVSRKVEKPRPLPATPGEPLWNYMPGVQANTIRKYIDFLHQDLYLTTNEPQMRESLLNIQLATAHVLQVLVDHLSSSVYHINQLTIARTLHQEMEA